MNRRLFVSQTSDGIKEAFEEKSELSTAHYKSGTVVYEAPSNVEPLCPAVPRPSG